MILNDIGRELGTAAVERIKSYVTDPPIVSRLTDLEQLFRSIYAPFGTLTDEEWRLLTEHSARRTRDGQFTLHYDPRVMRVFVTTVDLFRLSEPYDAVNYKTLVFVGEHTDLMTSEIIKKCGTAARSRPWKPSQAAVMPPI